MHVCTKEEMLRASEKAKEKDIDMEAIFMEVGPRGHFINVCVIFYADKTQWAAMSDGAGSFIVVDNAHEQEPVDLLAQAENVFFPTRLN